MGPEGVGSMNGCALRLGTVVLLAALSAAPVGAATRHVPATYPTIAAGLSAASAGDTVLVACGTYHEHALLMKSGVTLTSETGDPSCVTIDAEGLGRVMQCQGVSAATTIQGITFRNGHISGLSQFFWGGGILCSAGANPQILNCTFDSNVAQFGFGGGLSCIDSSPTVSNCTFTSNQAAGNDSTFSNGGAVNCLRSYAQFTGCDFENNISIGIGGAMYLDTSPVLLQSCEFRNNSAEFRAGAAYCVLGNVLGDATIEDCDFEDNTSGGVAGAVMCDLAASPVISDCTFRGNKAAQGGGGLVLKRSSSPSVTNVAFIENNGEGGGGGAVGFDATSEPHFGHCMFLRNYSMDGGALGCGGSGGFDNCTFEANSASFRGSFLWVQDASPVFNNCIVANQPAGMLIWCYEVIGLPFQPKFNCTDIYGNASGDWSWDCIEDEASANGNFSADPRFCDPTTDNYTLDGGSPCLAGHDPASPGCGLIGAYGQGCGTTATLPATWGNVKARFGPVARHTYR